ncbi:MAG: SAF domain-containing protein [Brachybacterium tyrofermentans]
MPLLPQRTKPEPGAPAASDEQPSIPTAAAGSPTKQRRRPTLIMLGVALIAVCAVGTWWITDRMSTTNQVVVAAADVSQGQVLTAEDLTTTDVNVPAGTAVITGSELDSLVGQRSTAAIEEGALLSPRQISSEALPGAGAAIVGVKVLPGQIPAQNVEPGDAVEVVGTPKPGDDPPSGDAPVIVGTIQAIGQPTTDGSIVVDVLVSEDQAGTLTALSATGRIGIVLVPEEE